MKFKYEVKTGEESRWVSTMWFATVEDALLMLKTLKKHFKTKDVSCEWEISGETFKA